MNMNVEVDRDWSWNPAPQTLCVIVCERTTIWTRALRREFGDLPPRIVETRTLNECRERLAASPTSIAAIEFTAATSGATLDFLSNVARDFPQATIVVLASYGCRPWEWLLREAGAVHVAHSPREMAAVVDIARRHLARFPQPLDLAARIITELDWGNVYD